MTRTGILVASALALSLSPSVLIAQNTARPNDPQIADIAYTAGQIDVEAAEQALKKTHNREVKDFAEEMLRDHTAVNKQALDLLHKLDMKPEPSGTSKSLSMHAAKARGAPVNNALEKTLIPNAQNSELKSFLQTGLKLFQEHERKAKELVREIEARPS